MTTEPLTAQQQHEINVRMNGIETRKPQPTKANVPIEDVFSASFARQIQKNEDLTFAIICIQNALELGQPEMALAQCKKALGR